MTRAPIPQATETAVLTSSARRCAFCFGLDGDLARKRGQIAHIDRDHSNAAETNLAFLCLLHHDEYDGRTSQTKNLTPAELTTYKGLLSEAITRGDHVAANNARSPDQRRDDEAREHDIQVFLEADDLLPEPRLRGILTALAGGHEITTESVEQLERFFLFFAEIRHEFLSPELQAAQLAYSRAMRTLVSFITLNFFVYPESQTGHVLRTCLYPELCIDRGGSGDQEDMQRYEEYSATLDVRVSEVEATFAAYRRAVTRQLHL